MTNLRTLADQLDRQDEALRQTLNDLLLSASAGAEAATMLRVVAEGILAIHERQRAR